MEKIRQMSRPARVMMFTVSLIAVVVLGVLCVEAWLRHMVCSAIQREVVSALGGHAEVEFGHVSVNLTTRTVAVHDLRIRAQNGDPGARNGTLRHRDMTLVSLDAAVERISARGIGYKKRGEESSITASALTVSIPRVTLVTKITADTLDSTRAGRGSQNHFYSDLSPLWTFSVGEVSMRGASLDWVSWLADGVNTRIAFDGGDLTVQGFSTLPTGDSSAVSESLPETPATPIAAGVATVPLLGKNAPKLKGQSPKILFSDRIRFSAHSAKYGFRLGDQTLRADDLEFDTAAASLSVGRLELVPQYPKLQFAERSRSHGDWTRASLDGIVCTGFDWARLLGTGAGESSGAKMLSIENVTLGSGEVASYKNRQVYQPPHTKPMFQQIIQQLPFALDVRTVAFSNFDVRYEELAPRGDSAGVVAITHIQGVARDITNMTGSAEIADLAQGAIDSSRESGSRSGSSRGGGAPKSARSRFMTVDIESSRLMGAGDMRAKFLFPVAASDDHWEVSGRIGPMALGAFNGAIEPLASVRITSGWLRGLDFYLTGTLASSRMRLEMMYADLGIEILKRHEREVERGFLTFVADGVLIRRSNPGWDGRLRIGRGSNVRDPERSMFNYIWRSFTPAIMKSVL